MCQDQEMRDQRLLTVPEVAQRLHCHPTTVKNLIRHGHIESVKMGRSRRIPADAVDALIDRLRHPATMRPA